MGLIEEMAGDDHDSSPPGTFLYKICSQASPARTFSKGFSQKGLSHLARMVLLVVRKPTGAGRMGPFLVVNARTSV